MWHDHPLGQRGWGLVATGEGGWTKFEKGGIGNAGGSPYNKGVRTPLPIMLMVKKG